MGQPVEQMNTISVTRVEAELLLEALSKTAVAAPQAHVLANLYRKALEAAGQPLVA